MTDSPSIWVNSEHQSADIIGCIAVQIKTQLVGGVLVDVYADSATEIALVFQKAASTFTFRLSISARDLLFQFVFHEIPRPSGARRMFRMAMNEQVDDVLSMEGERYFVIQLQDGFQLVVKCFGSMANLLLIQNGAVIDLFRNTILADHDFHLSNNLQSVQPETCTKSYQLIGDSQTGWAIQAAMAPTQDDMFLFETLNKFAALVLGKRKLETSRTRILKQLQSTFKKNSKLIQQTSIALEVLATQPSNEETANLIMSAIHLIPKGETSWIADDFYTGLSRSIKLNSNKSPIENAEHYYKKAKVSKDEMHRLKQQLDMTELQQSKLEEQINLVLKATTVKELKPWLKEDFKPQVATPFHLYNYEGYEILVGKNAKYNDELTFHIASKMDVFLHANGVSGSHVIIRNPAKSMPHLHVIERAAELAAWFSKAQGSNLVPVIYAFKKHVRKPKRSVPGLVIVTNETGIMVKPAN